jgi:NitT/TauT family transport system substrate-binding protein
MNRLHFILFACMRRQPLWAAGLAAGLALLFSVGCGGRDDGPKPLTEVRLGYFANVTHAQGVLGVSSGEMAAAVAPAKLSTKVFNAGPSLIEAVMARQIDVGYVGPGPAIAGFVQSGGTELKVVAGAAANGVLIVARKDAGIARLEDLAGKKLATPQSGNTQDIAARWYVKEVLKADVAQVVPVANGEQAGLMLRGQIDAAWVPEPWGSRLIEEAGAVLIGKEEDLWPDKQVNLTLIVATPAFIRDHPEVLERMLRVHCSWTARLAAEPRKYAVQLNDALAELTGKQMALSVVESSLTNVRFTDEPLDQTLTTMAQWSYSLGFLSKRPQLEGLLDLTLLRRIQKP